MLTRTAFLAIAFIVLPLLDTSRVAAGGLADPAPGLVGVSWALTTLQSAGQQPESTAGAGLTITFGMDGRVSGSGGCNQFTGGYTVDVADKLTISPLASTKIGCPTVIADRETRYFGLLQQANGYTFENNGATLRLTFAQSGPQLVFGHATANQAQVTGTVTYRQRIALPPNAVINVQLVDVSRQDVPAVVLAEQVGPAGGNAPPYTFTLGYDPLQIVAQNRYAVQASITVDGRLLFRSTQAYPVITQGRPSADVEVIVDQVGGGADPSGGPTSMPASGGGGMAASDAGFNWLALAGVVGGVALAFLLMLRRRAGRPLS